MNRSPHTIVNTIDADRRKCSPLPSAPDISAIISRYMLSNAPPPTLTADDRKALAEKFDFYAKPYDKPEQTPHAHALAQRYFEAFHCANHLFTYNDARLAAPDKSNEDYLHRQHINAIKHYLTAKITVDAYESLSREGISGEKLDDEEVRRFIGGVIRRAVLAHKVVFEGSNGVDLSRFPKGCHIGRWRMELAKTEKTLGALLSPETASITPSH